MKHKGTCAVVLLFLLAPILLTGGCNNRQPTKALAEGSPDVPGALSGMRMISPPPTGEWRLPAGDYANTRFSPLDQINNTNVKSLKVITTLSTGIPHGHEGQPLIVNNTM